MEMRRHERHRFTRPHVCNDNSFHDSLMTLCLYVNKPCTLSVSRPCSFHWPCNCCCCCRWCFLVLSWHLLVVVVASVALVYLGRFGKALGAPLYRCTAVWRLGWCVYVCRKPDGSWRRRWSRRCAACAQRSSGGGGVFGVLDERPLGHGGLARMHDACLQTVQCTADGSYGS